MEFHGREHPQSITSARQMTLSNNVHECSDTCTWEDRLCYHSDNSRFRSQRVRQRSFESADVMKNLPFVISCRRERGRWKRQRSSTRRRKARGSGGAERLCQSHPPHDAAPITAAHKESVRKSSKVGQVQVRENRQPGDRSLPFLPRWRPEHSSCVESASLLGGSKCSDPTLDSFSSSTSTIAHET